jgi:hypothetical protein
MKLNDVVTLAAIAAGLFMAGVVWQPVFGDYKKIKDALEGTSFLATAIAAVVAIFALNAWKSQFRHAERFKSLKDLKDAATDLHTLRGYLFCVERRCAHLMHTNGVPSEELEIAEENAKQKWLSALQVYNRAWGTAVVFFTPQEEKHFSGPANIFTDKYMDNTMRIVMLYANAPGVENYGNFTSSCRVITDSAKDLYGKTVSELEWMLRKKFGG